MSDHYFIHPDDARLWHDERDHTGWTALLDADGESQAVFPESWTEEQIMHALRFANRVYAVGLNVGYELRATEIRRSLGLDR